MSLAPELDEIGATINTTGADICLFTETWLSESVPDESLNLNGFQLLGAIVWAGSMAECVYTSGTLCSVICYQI